MNRDDEALAVLRAHLAGDHSLCQGCAAQDPEVAAWTRLPVGGPKHYQIRAFLPGGGELLCGISAIDRHWAAEDAARLLGQPERRIQVTKIPARDRPPDSGPRRPDIDRSGWEDDGWGRWKR